MKRFLLIVSVLFVSLQMYSQEQGKWYVGGKVGFDVAGVSMSIADSYDTVNSTTATINSGFGVEGGYFLTDKVKVGLGFEQSSSNSDNTSIVVLKSLYGSLAYYKEIVDGLYYVPEFKIGVVAGGSITMEDLNIPPFGFVVDYMTYGGIYRDVIFIEVENSHFDLLKDGTEAVFVTPHCSGKKYGSKSFNDDCTGKFDTN